MIGEAAGIIDTGDYVMRRPDGFSGRLGDHRFLPGEYVTIRHHGEEPLTYKVSEVLPS